MDSILVSYGQYYLLVVLRIGALTLSVPAVTGRVGIRLRVACVGAFALAASTFVQPVPVASEAMPLLCFQEAILGCVVGLTTTVFFQLARLVGTCLTQAAGGSFALIQNPADHLGSAPLERFFVLTAVACFFSVGGHRILFDELFHSLKVLPPTSIWDTAQTVEFVATTLSHCLRFALRIFMPLAGALLIASIGTSILFRFVPYFGFFWIRNYRQRIRAVVVTYYHRATGRLRVSNRDLIVDGTFDASAG